MLVEIRRCGPRRDPLRLRGRLAATAAAAAVSPVDIDALGGRPLCKLLVLLDLLRFRVVSFHAMSCHAT